jgi:uncharacterized protein
MYEGIYTTAMLTKNEIKNRIRDNTPLLRRYNVSKIGIFGSYVNGKPGEASDLDILIDFSGSVTLFQYVHLADSISDLLDTRVDLVTVSGIKPAIRDKVLREVEWVEGL